MKNHKWNMQDYKKQLLLPEERAMIHSVFKMPINTKSSGDGVELVLTGRIDGAVANELEVAIIQAIRGGAKILSINLAQASFICSAGLRVLLQYWRQMKGAGKQLVVTQPSAEIDSILEMTGFRDKMVESAKP